MTQVELLPALQFTPPVIALNFEELEARIDGITDQYKDVIVQEEDVPAYKEEMAGLNKLAVALGAARKDASAKISAPIKEFEDRVKNLEKKVLDTRALLDEQVKAHIQRERDGRRAAVQCMIDIQKDEHGCALLSIPIQENWLNKTAKDKVVTAEIQAIILDHKKIQEEKAKLEQAKKDRVVALESHIAALGQTRGYVLSFASFAHLQSLDMPLADALSAAEAIYAREDARRAPQPPAPAPEPTHWMDAPVEPEPPAGRASVFKMMTITATYDAAHGQEIGALYQRIKALCKTCTASVRLCDATVNPAQ